VRVEDFTYELPPELIAQTPLDKRSDSRLMVVDPQTQTLQHSVFSQLPDFLRPGDVLVLNNSKVLPARLYGVKQDTGAHIEVLLTRPVSDREWIAMAKPAKRLQPGTILTFSAREGDGATIATAEVLETLDDGQRRIRFDVGTSIEAFLDAAGHMPLPPYIHERLAEQNRYQTVYAKPAGSVAAPTAGLHFTEDLLTAIQAMGVEVHFVTLHVGIGTFKPVQVDRVEDHLMHSESYAIDEKVVAAVNKAKEDRRRVISVGTTALRTLESAARSGALVAGTGDTDIFIYPGYDFRVVDALITNFHLPKSTLIMLVSALAGSDFVKEAYGQAVAHRYRFFSFGDAMFITGRAQR
jgi:S-adenosylmethionine:tRNA ribosyltransferase-isomerase